MTPGRETGGAASPGGEDGHNYLASVSDLVSAFIFVFIIMLAIFAYHLGSATDDLMAEGETRDHILDRIKARLAASGIRVDVVPEQGVLRLTENAINFPSGSETPITGHHSNVGLLADAIAEVAPCFASESPVGSAPGGGDASVDAANRPDFCRASPAPGAYSCQREQYPWRLETLLIEGHTDTVPVGAGLRFRDNLELSSMRAATVHRMITACEPGVERLLNSHGHPILSTSGYGETRPVPDAETAAENRRIDLRFLLEPPPNALRRESDIVTDMRERVGDRRR